MARRNRQAKIGNMQSLQAALDRGDARLDQVLPSSCPPKTALATGERPLHGGLPRHHAA
jgi:hypothetical protein